MGGGGEGGRAVAREKWAAISRPNVSPILYGLLARVERIHSPKERVHGAKEERQQPRRQPTALFVSHLSPNSLLHFANNTLPSPSPPSAPFIPEYVCLSVCLGFHSPKCQTICFAAVAVAKGPVLLLRLSVRIAVAFIVVCALHKQIGNEFARRTAATGRGRLPIHRRHRTVALNIISDQVTLSLSLPTPLTRCLHPHPLSFE